MSSENDAPERRRLSKEERREHFLDTAAEIVSEHGVTALTMEGVAARAGVNKALGYRYFANREDLLVALFLRETERFDEQVRDRSHECRTLEEHIRAMLNVYLDSLTAGAMVVTLEGFRMGGRTFEESRVARERQSVSYLSRLIRRFYVVPGRTATLAAGVIAAGTQGLVGVWSTTGWPRERVLDEYVTMCIGAIEALASGPVVADD